MNEAARGLPGRQVASISRQQAVELAEAYLRAHPDDPVPVSRLCQVVGLSERGLRDAFYSVRGMGPKRWIVTVRLQGVRNALTETRAEPTTVTHVAADHGFYELGRFAASYRKAFGEAPSETLRSRQSENRCHAIRDKDTTMFVPARPVTGPFVHSLDRPADAVPLHLPNDGEPRKAGLPRGVPAVARP